MTRQEEIVQELVTNQAYLNRLERIGQKRYIESLVVKFDQVKKRQDELLDLLVELNQNDGRK